MPVRRFQGPGSCAVSILLGCIAVSFAHAENVSSSSASTRADGAPKSTAPAATQGPSSTTVPSRPAEAPYQYLQPIPISTTSGEGAPPISLHILSSGPAEAPNPNAPARVIVVFVDRNTTKLVVEARQPLIPGRNVYVGPDSVAATMGDLLSRTRDYYYYGASSPGRPKIHEGDEVSSEPPRARPRILGLIPKQTYDFEPKLTGEITAVQGGRALIDRGTLHEVRERDIYKIYGSDGRYKCMLEVRGLGDLQSSGILYNRFDDVRRDASGVQPGDRIELVGARKLLSTGLIAGQTFGAPLTLTSRQADLGAGFLWSLTFPDGWGLDVLIGAFIKDHSADLSTLTNVYFCNIGCPPTPSAIQEFNHSRAFYLAPFWLRKNFFYPFAVSPFLAVGPALIKGLNTYSKTAPPTPIVINENKTVTTVMPAVAVGFELFPSRLFRPRAELRYFPGPKLVAGGNTLNISSVFYDVGVMMAW